MWCGVSFPRSLFRVCRVGYFGLAFECVVLGAVPKVMSAVLRAHCCLESRPDLPWLGLLRVVFSIELIALLKSFRVIGCGTIPSTTLDAITLQKC